MTPIRVGLDLVDIARVSRLLGRKGDRAWERLLTEQERAYCRSQAAPARHAAARFAAKEATYKALAQDGAVGMIGWREVEVARSSSGGPELVLHGRARSTAERLGVTGTLLSLTHTPTHAAAVVILLG